MATTHSTSDPNASAPDRPFTRWTSSRPVLNGVMSVVAMVGLGVVVYLGQQQATGFEEGCSIGPLDASPTFGCAAAAGSAASTLLGVSNIVWGSLFYVAIALLSVAIALLPRWRGWTHRLRATGIGVGVLYSGYLTFYQFAYLDTLCAPCLASAGLVMTLAVLQVAALYVPSRFA